MSLFYLLLVAIIQGITEFLPISSSGHLAILPQMTGQDDQGLAIDIAVHVGSLFAVILYFWKEVKMAGAGCLRLMRGKVDTQSAFLALCLCIATVPVMVAGALVKLTGLDEALRSVAVIGWAMLGFGLVLYWADRTSTSERDFEGWTLRDALAMGLAQMLALIPGTSRAGITITAARKLGYSRDSAARISMLMSIPAILASGVVLSVDVVGKADWDMARNAVIASLFSFAAARLALGFMMRMLRNVSFTPYVVYRVILGSILLIYAYG